MGILINGIAIVLVIAGLVFFTGTAVGLIRFPDFYTRMHAAGKGDSLSTVLILAGVVVYLLPELAEHWTILLVMFKILAIAGFVMLTSPTSTHALMRAGFDDTNEPDPIVTNKDVAGPSLEEGLKEASESEGSAP